jgi:hypothetical protein
MSDGASSLGGQKVGADGKVTYDFEGHVHARGLDLDAAGVTTPPDTDRVRWLDGAGVSRGSVVAAKDGVGNTVLALVGGQAAQGVALNFTSGDAVEVFAGAQNRFLLDSAGKSNFLQLASLAKRTIVFGSANLTWPGGNQGSNGLVIAHGLGVVPVAVAALGNGQGVGFVVVQSYQAPDVNNIYLQGWDLTGIPALNTQRPVNWVAIG